MTDTNKAKHGGKSAAVHGTVVRDRRLQKIMIGIFAGCLLLMFLGTCYFGRHLLAADLRDIKTAGVENTIVNLEANFNDSLLGKEYFVDFHGGLARLIDMKFIRDADYSSSVVKDNHDNLQFMTYDVDFTGIENDLAVYTAGDSPVIFVQPPTKFIAGYTEFPPSLVDKTTQNVDALMAILQSHDDIKTLDLRQSAAEELNPENMFFRTDHHWTIETAFWAVDKTVDFIKEQTGLDLDPDSYYTDIANWKQEQHEKSFLGSQGRRVGELYGGLDDFTLITPNFDTDYHVSGLRDDEEVEGDFAEAVLEDKLLNFEGSVWTNHYAGYWGQDDAKVVVDNRLNDDGANVLLIKDSYGLPYGAFLSTMVDKLTVIDLRYYDINDLQRYIADSDFDLVIILSKMYNVVKTD